MKLVLIILFALIGCILGAFLAGIAYHEIALLLGAANAEGATALTAAYLVAPLGAVAGFVIGVILARKTGRNLKPVGARSAAVLVAVISAAGLGGYTYLEGGFDTYWFWQERPVIRFEIRLPAGEPAPSPDQLRGSLHSYTHSVPVQWDEPAVRQSGDHVVVSGSGRVSKSTDNRLIDYWTDSDKGRRRFFLGLPKQPGITDGFGEWIRVHRITDAQGATRNPDQPGDDFFIRLWVTKAGPD